MGFSRFRLPMLCPDCPDDEMVRVRVLRRKNGGTMVDNDFTDKEVDDGDNDVDFFDSRNDTVNDTDDADDGLYSEGAPATKKKRKKGAKTDTYADRIMCSPDGTAHHRRKFSMFKDGFNTRWKECVEFGKWLTFDESRVAGWYHSPITQEPDPMPIRTGATIHSLAITHGNLASYKVHIQVFGGKTDGDLGKENDNTVTIQKWVNLLSVMLDAFKNKGHCVTMDSAYMGDIMAMIGRDVWRINMVGTAQANRTGANIECTKSMKKGTYESVCWQHVWRNLCFAVWSDNALVRTLSNFHGPVILKAGMGVLRKKRDEDGKRERHKTEVPCPAQTKDYCATFHLIDKGNGAEASYDLGVGAECTTGHRS